MWKKEKIVHKIESDFQGVSRGSHKGASYF